MQILWQGKQRNSPHPGLSPDTTTAPKFSRVLPERSLSFIQHLSVDCLLHVQCCTYEIYSSSLFVLNTIAWRGPCKWTGSAHPFSRLHNTPLHCCSWFTCLAPYWLFGGFQEVVPRNILEHASSYGVRTSMGYLEMKSLGQRWNRRSESSFFGFFNFLILYWSIVDWQCCISFRCTARWLSYT